MKAPHLWRIAALFVVLSTRAQTPTNASLPKLIYSELPTYPERAMTAHVIGPVQLWFMVGDSGVVAQAGVISGNSLLRGSALEVVKSWKFRGGSFQSNTRYETEFIYDLEEQSKQGEPKLTVSMTDLRRVEVVSEIYEVSIE